MQKHKIAPRFFLVLVYGLLAACLPAIAASAPVRTRLTAHKRTAATTSGVATFADSAKDYVTTNDDPLVRQAAVMALGRYNGSVVAIDPLNGRILSIVNQKLAFSSGFKPCSTIKPVIALAALQEGFG